MPTSGDLPYPPADGRGQRQEGKQAVWHEALVPGKTAESCFRFAPALMLNFVGEVEVNTVAWESGPWEPNVFMKVSTTRALFLIS